MLKNLEEASRTPAENESPGKSSDLKSKNINEEGETREPTSSKGQEKKPDEEEFGEEATGGALGGGAEGGAEPGAGRWSAINEAFTFKMQDTKTCPDCNMVSEDETLCNLILRIGILIFITYYYCSISQHGFFSFVRLPAGRRLTSSP